MSNTIHILDETTANKIAAGEVVERPSSVIKELIENSIDAKSTSIEIEIEEGGTIFIRVTDNGMGMSMKDAQLAILRHATSKIRSAEDLYNIHSLGFRGEALPSIASVSKFSLTTRPKDQSLATYLSVHGGAVQEVREAGGNVGTTITVEDLFFNTPARKKFLKTISTESSHIHDVITKLSLSHPHIAFKLINNHRLVLSTPGTGQLFDALTSLYGHKIAPDLLPVNFQNEDDQLSISGYLAKPTLLKSSRLWQTYIVNSRVVSNRAIAKALDNAYHSLLPKSGYPLAVLAINIPADTIDVNVHPQKSEVKFSDEQKIFRAVYKAITNVLSSPHTPNELAASVHLKETVPYKYQSPSHSSSTFAYNVQTERSWNSPVAAAFKEQPLSFSAAQTALESEKLAVNSIPFFEEAVAVEDSGSTHSNLMLYPLGQVEDCYIVTKGSDGLYIIDQHAAHERILYDKLNKNGERIPTQQLLMPLFLDFDKKEIHLILDNEATFQTLGFSFELAGPVTLRLSEIPADIPSKETESFIQQILESIQEMKSLTPQQLRHKYFQMTACRSAIKAGDSLNMRQMQALVNELCNTTLPYTCPHGRPAMIRFTSTDLAKLFKRIQ